MTDNELRAQTRRAAPQIKIAAGVWVVGWVIIALASVLWVALAVMGGDYYANSKAVRDAAESGSAVLGQLAAIQSLEAWVLPLSFLGVATFLFGFGFAFANILRNIGLRGNTMAAVFPAYKSRHPKD